MMNEDYTIQQYLAGNLNTPPELLYGLARSESSNVRRQVARNPGVDPEILVKLSRDESPAVRENVCRNKNVPTDVLLRLCKDSIQMVSRTADRVFIEKDPFYEFRQDLLRKQGDPPE